MAEIDYDKTTGSVFAMKEDKNSPLSRCPGCGTTLKVNDIDCWNCKEVIIQW